MTEKLKACTDCKRELPLESFPKSSRKSDTLYYWCRECVKRRWAAYYSKTAEQQNAKAREYFKTEKGKATAIKSYQKMKTLNPEKLKARSRMRYAVRSGRIKKPTSCPECFANDKRIEAHHYLGYEEEHWYDIKWLCSICHKKVHGFLREELLNSKGKPEEKS